MSPRLQVSRMDGILVKAFPFLERIHGQFGIFRGVPIEHVRMVVNADAFAEGLDYVSWLVEQIVCVNNADLHASFAALAIGVSVGKPVRDTVGMAVSFWLLTCQIRSNCSVTAKKIKQLTELEVTSFVVAKAVEASGLIQRRDAAAIIARDARLWVANKESKMELFQNIQRHHRWIARFRVGVVRSTTRGVDAVKDFSLGLEAATADQLGGTLGGVVRANTAAWECERGSDRNRILRWWKEILSHILDQDTLVLRAGQLPRSCPPRTMKFVKSRAVEPIEDEVRWICKMEWLHDEQTIPPFQRLGSSTELLWVCGALGGPSVTGAVVDYYEFRENARRKSHLMILPVDVFHDGLERGVGEAAFLSSGFVIFESLRQTLWSIVVSVAKRLMDALEGVPPSHEDLLNVRLP